MLVRPPWIILQSLHGLYPQCTPNVTYDDTTGWTNSVKHWWEHY